MTIINVTHEIDHCKYSDNIFLLQNNLFKETNYRELKSLI